MSLPAMNTQFSGGLASITGYRKYGILSSTLHHAMVNTFHLPEQIKKGLEQYYILHWAGRYLKQKLTDGIIEHQGYQYIVIFKGITLPSITGTKQIRLSFRRAKSEYNLPAYVLVSPEL